MKKNDKNSPMPLAVARVYELVSPVAPAESRKLPPRLQVHHW